MTIGRAHKRKPGEGIGVGQDSVETEWRYFSLVAIESVHYWSELEQAIQSTGPFTPSKRLH